MEDFLLGLLKEFALTTMRAGAEMTAKAAYNYIGSSFNSSSNAKTKLYHVGTNFYMKSNTILYYSFEDNIVYGYSLNDFGNRWVTTQISTSENPSNYDGGYFYVQRFYRDQYGNLYKD